jgi:hypothetical protein
LVITTDGGTTFAVKDRQVTITHLGQPQCVIPLADLREFIGFLDLEESDDED